MLDRYSLTALQAGQPVWLADDQRRLLTAGLALHEQGREAMKQRNFLEALTLLQHSEQAFDAVDDSLVKAIDNVGLMLLDLVWCAYLVQACPHCCHGR